MYAKDYPQHVSRVIQIGPAPLQWNERFADSLHHRLPPDSIADKVIGEAYKAGLARKDPALFSRLIFEVAEKPRLIGNPEKTTLLGCQWGDHTRFVNEQFSNFTNHMRHQFASVPRLNLNKEDFMRLGVPLLVIHGTKDSHSPFGAGKQWSSLVKGSRFLRVDGAAHLPWIEAPEVVFAAIRGFLKNK